MVDIKNVKKAKTPKPISRKEAKKISAALIKKPSIKTEPDTIMVPRLITLKKGEVIIGYLRMLEDGTVVILDDGLSRKIQLNLPYNWRTVKLYVNDRENVLSQIQFVPYNPFSGDSIVFLPVESILCIEAPADDLLEKFNGMLIDKDFKDKYPQLADIVHQDMYTNRPLIDKSEKNREQNTNEFQKFVHSVMPEGRKELEENPIKQFKNIPNRLSRYFMEGQMKYDNGGDLI